MNADETRTERAFTELFHRLPLEPVPLGFRDAVMSRIAASTARAWRWEWIIAALIALPNAVFLLWSYAENGDDISAALAGVMNALLGLEAWDGSASVYVDGLLVLAVALVGVAALLATHALVSEERHRTGSLPA